MPAPVRVGDYLAYISEAMRVTHDRVCDREDGHRWERCPETPSLFATGDALDLLDRGATVEVVAAGVHARMCPDPSCGMAESAGHVPSYLPIARAMGEWHGSLRPDAPSEDSYLALCVCGHRLRGHSLDRLRCYAPACPCTHDGGFRPRLG